VQQSVPVSAAVSASKCSCYIQLPRFHLWTCLLVAYYQRHCTAQGRL